LNKRSKNWIGVLNNWGQGELENILMLSPDPCLYLVAGREKGASGTPHLQCTFVFTSLKGFKGVKAVLGPRWHIEPCVALEASIAYCKKEGDFEERGIPPVSLLEKGAKGAKGAPHGQKGAVHGEKGAASGALGGESEKCRWRVALEAAKVGDFDVIHPQIQVVHARNLEFIYNRAMREKPRPQTQLENYWFYGRAGTGKSMLAREMFPKIFVKMINKWWDGYKGEDEVLMEDIDPSKCAVSGHYLKTWVDRYPFPAEVKGSSVMLRPGVFVITSNYSVEQCFPNPEDLYAVLRRFKVYKFEAFGTPPVLECDHGERADGREPPLPGTHPTFVPSVEESDEDEDDEKVGMEDA